MNARQRLKKEIYKSKQLGLDTAELQQKLADLSNNPEVLVAQKLGEYNELFNLMKADDFSSYSYEKYYPKIGKLDIEIKALRQTINDNKEPIWEVPYFIKKIIKDRNGYSYSDIVEEINDFYKESKPKNIEVTTNDKKTRYIVLEANGISKRFNLMTKKEFVSQNSYWLLRKNIPGSYKICKYNYTNCLKYIY